MDYELNDIFLHVDRNSNLSKEDKIDIASVVKKANIRYLKSHKVAWGGDSLMRIEISLLKEATKTIHRYYHLLSGSDLPLKPQTFIHRVLANDEHDYIALETNTVANKTKNFQDRYRYYYMLQNRIGRYNKSLQKLQNRDLILQKKFNIDRTKKVKFEYVKGSQWFSITHKTAEYILSQYNEYKKYFLCSYVPDESFVQTIIKNSPIAINVVDDNLRLIDWQRGKPYTFLKEDYNELINSDKLFARKFDEKVDNSIIDIIYEYITKHD